MGIKVANNAFATLAAGISDSDTSITVSTGQGARFPALGAGDYFYATLINTSNQLEIVECTARSGDVLTVVRAQESTAARAYDVGDRIEIRITAQTFADATSNAENFAYTGTLTGGTGVVNLGSGQLVKDANGNVGIGTSSPRAVASFPTLDAGSSTGGFILSGGSTIFGQLGAAEIDGFAKAGSRSNHPFVLTTNNVERMRITSAGNVGIGTSSPTELLSLEKNGSTIITLNRIGAAPSLARVANTANALVLESNAPNGVQIFTGSTPAERMRIDSSGNLLVGTTSTPNGGSNFFAAGGATILNTQTNVSSGTNHIVFRNSNGNVGSIQTSGSSTSYNISSDYRLKEQVQPMTSGLAKVAALKPVTYKWKVDGSDGEGFIAHELAEVCPQAVTGEKDAVDAQGRPVYQGVDTSFLVATLTAALQELNAKFDAYVASHP